MHSSTVILILHALCLVNAAYIPAAIPRANSIDASNLPSFKPAPRHEYSLNQNSPKSPLSDIKRVADSILLPNPAALQKRQIHNADYSTKKPTAPQNANANTTSADDSSGSSNGAESDSQQNAQKRDTFVEASARDHQHQARDPHRFLLPKEKAHRRRHLPSGSKGPLMQSAPVQPGAPHKVDGRSVLSSFSHMVSRASRNTIWFSARAAHVPAPSKPSVELKHGLPVPPSPPSPKEPKAPKREPSRDVETASDDAFPVPQTLSSAAAADSIKIIPSLAGAAHGFPKTLTPEADKVAAYQHSARWSSRSRVTDDVPVMRRWMLSESE